MRYVRQMLTPTRARRLLMSACWPPPSKRPATALRPASPTPTLTWVSRTWPRWSNASGLCLDCADICTATAGVLSRPAEVDPSATRLLLRACAAICQSCGDECERHAHMPHCRVCAEACRRCDRACRELLDAWE